MSAIVRNMLIGSLMVMTSGFLAGCGSSSPKEIIAEVQKLDPDIDRQEVAELRKEFDAATYAIGKKAFSDILHGRFYECQSGCRWKYYASIPGVSNRGPAVPVSPFTKASYQVVTLRRYGATLVIRGLADEVKAADIGEVSPQLRARLGQIYMSGRWANYGILGFR